MKKTWTMLLCLALAFCLLSGCTDEAPEESLPETTVLETTLPPAATLEPTEPEPTEAAYQGRLTVAVPGEVVDSGLLDDLAPVFRADTGWELVLVTADAADALKLGENGEVDVILACERAREETFVEKGFGVGRLPVMYSEYIILGPAGPIDYTEDVEAVFRQILEEELVFVSCGDAKELAAWKALDMDPAENENYWECDESMEKAIALAEAYDAYCFADRLTYLQLKNDPEETLELGIVCEGSRKLRNLYSVITVNTELYPDLNHAGARAFASWLRSEKAQALIGEYGMDMYGEPIFGPNAI